MLCRNALTSKGAVLGLSSVDLNPQSVELRMLLAVDPNHRIVDVAHPKNRTLTNRRDAAPERPQSTRWNHSEVPEWYHPSVQIKLEKRRAAPPARWAQLFCEQPFGRFSGRRLTPPRRRSPDPQIAGWGLEREMAVANEPLVVYILRVQYTKMVILVRVFAATAHVARDRRRL